MDNLNNTQLTNRLRPVRFNDVFGQENVVGELRRYVENPESAPKAMIFSGSYGTGKTSCARVFARELNINDSHNPNADILNEAWYDEYDIAFLNSKRDLASFIPDIQGGFLDYWRIVVFDEIQNATGGAQELLLKKTEEPPSKTFFIFCTTNIERIIDTLRSRCATLYFKTSTYNDMFIHLSELEKSLGKNIPTEVKENIAFKSYGHFRDAHMLLDRYLNYPDIYFDGSELSNITLFSDFFCAVYKDKQELMIKTLNKFANTPAEELRNDFDAFIIMCSHELVNVHTHNNAIKKVIELFGDSFLRIVDIYFNEWTLAMFHSYKHFHLAMINYYKMYKNSIN